MSEAFAKAPSLRQCHVFPIACWTLGVVGFAELIVGGMSLAARLEDSRQVRIVEREVQKIVAVEVPAKRSEIDAPSVVTRPPVAAAPAVIPALIVTPRIDDPVSERLVREAQKARVAGDMGVAIVKLQESLKQSPNDPNVNYELGLVHESMGVYDAASSYYQKVFEMGVSGAGSLYELAAGKLRDGFEQPDFHGKLALGRVRIFRDTRFEDGERTVLTIPVQKDSAVDIDPAEVGVEVMFFNKTSKGEILQLPDDDKSWVKDEWPAPPFDFAGGEEPCRVIYTIPGQDTQTEHLFGQEKYYGQVVSLKYRGEVIDVQAWPRDLVSRLAKPPVIATQQQAPAFDQLPPDFNPSAPLLPTLEPPQIEKLLPPPLPRH